MSLEDLTLVRRNFKSFKIDDKESFIDTENIENENEEYRKKVARISAGAIIGCFLNGGVALVNHLSFENEFIYALVGVGFVVSFGAGVYNLKRDFEITRNWYR
jgi:hypothetical protein